MRRLDKASKLWSNFNGDMYMINSIQQGLTSSARVDLLSSSKSSRRQTDSGAASETNLSVKNKNMQTLRAGFGKDTVSVPGATMRTLGKGLDGARQVVPTLEDLQEETRDRVAQQRESLAKDAAIARDFQPFRASQSAAQNAQDLVNGINSAEEMAQARLSGETPPETGTRATLVVNGQSMGYIQSQAGTESVKSGSLDVFA